jgi:hypothetical protein
MLENHMPFFKHLVQRQRPNIWFFRILIVWGIIWHILVYFSIEPWQTSLISKLFYVLDYLYFMIQVVWTKQILTFWVNNGAAHLNSLRMLPHNFSTVKCFVIKFHTNLIFSYKLLKTLISVYLLLIPKQIYILLKWRSLKMLLQVTLDSKIW